MQNLRVRCTLTGWFYKSLDTIMMSAIENLKDGQILIWKTELWKIQSWSLSFYFAYFIKNALSQKTYKETLCLKCPIYCTNKPAVLSQKKNIHWQVMGTLPDQKVQNQSWIQLSAFNPMRKTAEMWSILLDLYIIPQLFQELLWEQCSYWVVWGSFICFQPMRAKLLQWYHKLVFTA